jgi:hypothetical protein
MARFYPVLAGFVVAFLTTAVLVSFVDVLQREIERASFPFDGRCLGCTPGINESDLNDLLKAHPFVEAEKL